MSITGVSMQIDAQGSKMLLLVSLGDITFDGNTSKWKSTLSRDP